MDTTTGVPARGLAAAIREQLPHGTPWRVQPSAGGTAVDLLIRRATRPGAPVAAAITDDAHAGEVLWYAWRQSRRLGATLRAVHVWTGAGERPDESPDADRLLSAALYDILSPDQVRATEREILHDRDPGWALRALSRELCLLVVGAASEAVTPDRPFGRTVATLIGRTWCPLTVVLPSPAADGVR